MRLPVIVALTLAAAPAAADWRAAAWGAAPDAAIAQVTAVRPMPGAMIYGGGLRAELLGEDRFAGLAFRALWQFDDRGLRQVLMERRGAEAGPRDAAALFDALIGMFGAPDLRCAKPPAGGRPGAAELIWRLHGPGSGGVLHAVWIDFSTAEAFTRTVGDILRPFPETPPLGPPQTAEDAERDRAARRAIRGQSPDYALGGLRPAKAPRRLLVRWRDPAAIGLSSRACP